MLAAGSCGGCRFVNDAGFHGVHFFLKGYTPVICVNAVDKGDSKRLGVKAVDKGVAPNLKSENRNWQGKSLEKLKIKSVLVQKGKELGDVAGAGNEARSDFTGHDRAR